MLNAIKVDIIVYRINAGGRHRVLLRLISSAKVGAVPAPATKLKYTVMWRVAGEQY